MNVFDIIGPIMIGPSSSHTAGAVRLGQIARLILGEPPVEASIELHGSFAKTYHGHGTDRALAAGILGIPPGDQRVRDGLLLADSSGLKIHFEQIELSDAHPNTVRIRLSGISGKRISMRGASVGGGSIRVEEINTIPVVLDAHQDSVVLVHRDIPGAIAGITEVCHHNKLNISRFQLVKTDTEGVAVACLSCDTKIDPSAYRQMASLPTVLDGMLIPQL